MSSAGRPSGLRQVGNGGGPATAGSRTGTMTGSAAWIRPVMMAPADVLTRLVVDYLRGRRLAAAPAAPAAAPIPVGARA